MSFRIMTLHNAPNTKTATNKRWQSAFMIIHCSRAFMSHLTPNKTNKNKAKISPSPSFTVIDLNSQHHFSIDQTSLTNIVNEKNLQNLEKYGGVEGVAAALETNIEYGMDGDDSEDIARRHEVFGSNTYNIPPLKSFFHSVVDAFKDVTIPILLAFGALSLGFGIKEYGAKEGWYYGGSIFIAVFFGIFMSSISNFRKTRQFDKLSQVKNDIQIDVVRSGNRQQISIFEIVVGDVICLKIGDQVPADGLFIDGHSVRVDESSMTGESEYVEINRNHQPFLFSGTKVVDGFAKMLVTSVGMNTTWGQMMSSISRDVDEQTPFQARLNELTSSIEKVGFALAFLVLVALLICYFTGNTYDEYGFRQFNGSKTKFEHIMNTVVGIVDDAITIIAVAIPDEPPLAMTLTLAYSMEKMMAGQAMMRIEKRVRDSNGSKTTFKDIMKAVVGIVVDLVAIVAVAIPEGIPELVILYLAHEMKKMMADQAIVRKLSACETMGSATTICTDKTGTLTLNQMKVTKFWLGLEPLAESGDSSISPYVVRLIQEGVALNTTGSVHKSQSGSEFEFSGSPTEKAILSWAVKELNMEMEQVTKGCSVLHVETFNSEKKRSGVLLRRKVNNTVNAHWKGAAEMVLRMCSRYYDASGIVKGLDNDTMLQFEHIIQDMDAASLRCIAFAHVEVGEEETGDEEGNKVVKDNGLTLLGLVGIKDPCRPGVKEAIEACRQAGVNVKMITSDNICTAKAIAAECGILRPNQDTVGAVVEGEEFRNYGPEERLEKVEQICVMARSSHFDKLLMVECLKQKGHVVAVTGDDTNDAPALKEADTGLSMGIRGTEVAKESSDIVILDDNFATVVTVLRWGRCVYNNIQKFIQFQLAENIAAFTINFVARVSTGEVPLTVVQLLWVNLIKDTLGALALAREKPTMELMWKPPVGRTQPLITNIMWRNLLAQTLYQIAVLLTLLFKGEYILRVTSEVKYTLIFNTFVLCQVFNEFNARNLEKKNVFEGIHKNKLFLGIIGVTVVLQVVMVESLKKFADTERLNLSQWAVCIILATFCLPIGWVVKLIPVPDKPFLDFLSRVNCIHLNIKCV